MKTCIHEAAADNALSQCTAHPEELSEFKGCYEDVCCACGELKPPMGEDFDQLMADCDETYAIYLDSKKVVDGKRASAKYLTWVENMSATSPIVVALNQNVADGKKAINACRALAKGLKKKPQVGWFKTQAETGVQRIMEIGRTIEANGNLLHTLGQDRAKEA